MLSDFGVVRDEHASLTRTGQIVGTPAFAPPEQLLGQIDRVGPAADVFALGATLHWAFAGKAPFAGRTTTELVASIEARTRRPLTALGLPRDLETIVGKCLEARAEDRYASAEAVADDIENLLALRPIAARPLGTLPRTLRLLRRNKRTVVAAVGGGILVLTACALLAWFLWQRWTLPERVAAEVRRAQWALLEPTHEERVILADRGDGPGRVAQFATSAESALAAYDGALRLMPARDDIRREREVVAYARTDLRADTYVTEKGAAPASIRAHVPLPPHLATDRRLRGLHAFLLGDARTCHAAWADLDLAPGAVNPLVDAAAGQMHLAREEAAKAYPRLLRALDAWPDAGFLAVGVADCAVRLGDLAKAEQYLAVAERLGLRDPFSSHVRVRADLRAAQGRNAEAHADYEWMLVNHKASLARLHYARLLEREGELERAMDLLFEVFERQPDRTRYGARLWELAESWWTSLPMSTQVTEVLASWNTTESWPRLRRFATAREVLGQESQETRTADTASASPSHRRHTGSISILPTEFAVMTSRECELLRRVPSTVQYLVASAMLMAHNPIGRRLAERAPGPWLAMRLATWPCVLATGWIATLLSANAAGQVQWVDLTPSGSPVGRRYAATAFDAARSVVLMYGGSTGTQPYFADLWSWNGRVWSLLQTQATPGPRSDSKMVYDVQRCVTVMFGGLQSAVEMNDTWTWNGTTWTQHFSSVSPPPRGSHAMAYDEARGVVVLFGGGTATGSVVADTWEWDGSQWANRTPTTGPSPAPVDGAVMVYDPTREVMVLFGGKTRPTHTLRNDTWEWDGTRWTRLTPTSTPAGRYHFGMDWDADRACAVVFGGTSDAIAARRSDLWKWDGVNWTERQPEMGPAPVARFGHFLVYDGVRRQTVLFSGNTTGTTHPADTWILEPKNGAHADYTSTGPGCPGIQGTPSLAAVPGSLPWIGRTFTAQVTSIPNFFPVSLFLLGFSNPGVPGLFCRPACTLRAFPDLISALAPTGNQATWSIPIPNDCNLLGLNQLFTQVVVFNFATGCVDALSNGMQMTIGAR